MSSAGFETAIPVTKRLQALDLTATRTGTTAFTYKNFTDPVPVFKSFLITVNNTSVGTADGGTVVKVLCYKSEGRCFDSRWCHWNFSLT
jgi:hypothetical protein